MHVTAFLVIAVDPHYLNIVDAQTTAMRNFLHPQNASPRPLPARFPSMLEYGRIAAPEHAHSPCDWQGVYCQSGTVRTIRIHTSNFKTMGNAMPDVLIDMRWMPPTTTFVGLTDLHVLNGWATERLPRALVHMSLRNVFSHQIGTGVWPIDWQKLPRKMEELSLINGWYYGETMIDRLPVGMRLLRIRHSSIQMAYVHFESLPLGLERLAVRNGREGKDGVRICGMGVVKDDPRVSTEEGTIKWKYTV